MAAVFSEFIFFPVFFFSYSSSFLFVEFPTTNNFKTNMASIESVKNCASSDKIEDPYKGAWEYLDTNNIIYLIQVYNSFFSLQQYCKEVLLLTMALAITKLLPSSSPSYF